MTLNNWLLLLVPILTGAFALIGSWFGSRLGRVTEHKQWVRNEKRKAYGDFLGAVLEARRESEPGSSDPRKLPGAIMHGLSEKQGLVQVFGTDRIAELCSEVTVTVGVLSIALSESYGQDNSPEQKTRVIIEARKNDEESFNALVTAIRTDLKLG